MLMDLLYKWPAPELLEKNNFTNKQICVHIAPAVLFVSLLQLEMHFDDSQFYFFHTFLKMYVMRNIDFFHEIYGDRFNITQSRNLRYRKNHK